MTQRKFKFHYLKKYYFFIIGNKRSEAAKIELLFNKHAKPVLLEDYVNQYLSETLPEGLPYAKEFEAELANELMKSKKPEKKPRPTTRFQYPVKNRQKRELTPRFAKDNVDALENHIHSYLMKHDPSALPYAREIQNDVLAFLWEMKRMRMSAMRSNEPNFEGALKKRSLKPPSEPMSMKLEDFIRDILAKEYPQYLPEIQKIKSEVVHVLKRLGLVEKQ